LIKICKRLSKRLRLFKWVRERHMLLLMLAPALIYLGMIAYYPLASAFRSSFFQGDNFVGLENYLSAFKREYFLNNLLNSFYFSFGVVLGQNILGLSFAVLLNRKIRFRNMMRGLQFLPWLLPPVVAAVIWLSFYLPVQGLINTILRNLGLSTLTYNWLGNESTALAAVIVTDIWHFYPFFSIMYLASMQGIPETLYEAAKIDGANSWVRFKNITLPLLRPTMLTCSLVQLIWVFRFFDLIWVMTRGGPSKASEVLATQVYKTALFMFDFNEASALGIIMTLFMLMFTLIYLYFYRKGEKAR